MDIEKLFDFFREMVPQIGVLPTIFITLFIIAIFVFLVVILKVISNKDKIVEKVIEEQSKQSQKAMEFMKTAVSEIKELSIMSTTELKGHTGKLENLVDILNLLITDGTIKKKNTPNNNQDLPDGGDGS